MKGNNLSTGILCALVVIMFLIPIPASLCIENGSSGNHSSKLLDDIKPVKYDDILDQQQTQHNTDKFVYIGPDDFDIWAQSFTPSVNNLTRIDLLISNNNAIDGFVISVFGNDTLDWSSLVGTAIVPADAIPSEPTWIEFDFADADVVPGLTYYILVTTQNKECGPSECYRWYAYQGENLYENGAAYYYVSEMGDPELVEYEPSMDFCFKTYSHINNKPETPSITGPTSGDAGDLYEYIFTATDPDGDYLYYYIEWGGNCPSEEWVGPYYSGEEIILNNTWDEEGNYTIRAKVKDRYDATSDWGTLKVSMPITHRTLWERFVEWLFTILFSSS